MSNLFYFITFYGFITLLLLYLIYLISKKITVKDMKNNKKLLKNKISLRKKLKAIKTIFYGRLILIILLLLIQIAIFSLFIFALEPYIQYFIGTTTLLGILFIVYLANCKGKNEFKIAWLVPVLILPIFGIGLYFIYKTNPGGRKLNQSIKDEEQKSSKYLKQLPDSKEAKKLYPKMKDIASYLENNGNYPCYTNSSIKYFPSGELFFADIIEELNKAQKFIFLEYFIIEPGYMWHSILAILKKKVSEGVEVKVLYDSLGSITLSSSTYERYLSALGIQAKIFLPFVPIFNTGLNNRDHKKILNIDGKIAYTGGINISDEYINKEHPRFNYWKDTAVKITGPAVRSFTAMFIQQWNIANKTKIEYEKYINIEYPKYQPFGTIIPYADNAHNNEDIAENIYNYILSKSHNYVHIMTPYIIIDSSLLEALIFAAKRNVNVELIVPKNYDHFITFCVGRTFIKKLIENGIKVYEYEPGFIHAKSFVSDDNRACIGSVNLDYRSLYHHFECGAFIYSSPVIADIEQDFQETKKQCTLITMETYKKIPLHIKLIGWFFHVFSPLL